MLQNIRDKSQGPVLWIVVILIISTFAVWGIHSYVVGSRQSHTPAIVNHITITQAQVMSSYERLRQQEQMQLGANFSLNPTVEGALKRQALNQLVVSTVLVQAATKSGYRVTTDQVNEALLKIPAFQESGQFSVNRFREVLSGILYSQNSFLIDMRNSMLIGQVQSGYVNSAFALPGEVDNAIRLVNQKRDISYVIIPAAHFSRDIHLRDEDVKNYYQTHQNEFQSPEQVSLQYLELSLPAIKAQMHFDETKVQQYYENNIESYTKPASWHVAYILIKIPQDASPADVEGAEKRMDDIQHQLKSGARFSVLARKYSQDIASSKSGGELDWFSAGTLDPSFEKAVANLKSVGDVSEPVRTSYGLSLIKLLGVKKAEVMPFSAVKSQVESTLAEQQAEQIFSQESDKLSNLTYSNPTTLEIAAKALNMSVGTTDLFTRDGMKVGIASNAKIVEAAFSRDVLQNGNNSDLIQLDPNTVAVVRVKNHQPQAVLPFADVENTIAQKLRNQQAQEKAEALGQSWLKQIEDNKSSAAALSRENAFPWQVDKDAGRYDSRVDSRILTEAFSMPYPNDNASVKGVRLPSGDYAIIEVDAVHQGELPKSDDSISHNIFKEELEKNYGQIDYQLYVRELMKNSSIKLNQSVLDAKPDNP
ncbi:MAG: SurA N-terminal domain-containing protein [Gammaproteobacteria bacterium]|nr:SurA N-terminal domain-containing protein [Gammaproteobacteria bacterium]